jgi:DNA-directed RNA polymerase I subunit RPA1
VKPTFRQNDYTAGSKDGSNSDAASEGEENVADDAMDTDEGSGDDTAEAPIAAMVARTASGKVKGPRGRNERVITPNEARAHLRWLFTNESVICSLLFGRQGPYAPIIVTQQLLSTGLSPVSADMFFLDVVTVSPTRFRPASKMADKFFEHPHNELLAKIINTTYTLRDLSDQMKETTAKGASTTPEDQNRIFGKMLDGLIVLQADVNSFIDSSKNTGPLKRGKLALPGVKQGLEKKEGLFRMHMMVPLFFDPVYDLTLFAGKTCKLCRTIRNLPRRQYRDERDRGSSYLRAKTYVFGAGHAP